MVPAPISPSEKSLGCTNLALTQKGLGMLEISATFLIVAFFLYYAWPWLWHIATTLALSFLVYYIVLPLFWQSQSWQDLKGWLQQLQLTRQSASASSMPSDRLYVSPLRTQESRDHFEALGREEYPRPYPRPILVDRSRGYDVFRWKEDCWFLRHNEEPYRYLCVVDGRLQWCWPARPNASAEPCRSPDTKEDGWCWKNGVG